MNILKQLKMFNWRRLRLLTKRGHRLSLIICLCLCLLLKIITSSGNGYMPQPPAELKNRNFDKYVTKFDQTILRNTTMKKILVWTPFFGATDWDESIRSGLLASQCPAVCTVTKDRQELETSDAVLFHPSDLWPYGGFLGTLYQGRTDLPKTRHPDQVWATFSLEPIIHMWGTQPAHTFNWTIFYRREATIYAPFGGISPDEQSLKSPTSTKRNYFKEKSKFASTLVSNCKDQAKRYKILNELKKHIDLDDFGACSGRFLCKAGMPTTECGKKHLSHYKFYIAFENSYCRDYVSEKFWNALERRQIPVIAAPKYTTELLPPRSYINVFDFPSIKAMAARMIEIGRNETLYNSYFDWIASYKVDQAWECKLCTALHTNMRAQSYNDIEGWIKDDICTKNTPTSLLANLIDRFLFDLGLS